MQKLFILLAAVLMTTGVMAEQKFSFIIGGNEQEYNQIRITNRTSLDHIRCRAVVLGDENEILSVYGIYDLNGYDDTDSNTNRIKQGTRIGIQFPEEITTELTYSVEYKDYPFFDAVVIILYDNNNEFGNEF